MAETLEVNECQLSKKKKVRRYNKRMITLGLQPKKYIGEQINSLEKKFTKCRQPKRIKAQKNKTLAKETIVVE